MIVVLLKFISWLFSAMPQRMALGVGRCLGRLFGALYWPARQRASAHLALAFSEWTAAARRRVMSRMFEGLGMNTVEMLRWLGGREEELRGQIHAEGLDHVEQAFSRGKGVLVLTAHTGNWDLMGLWAASQWPLTIISKEIRNAALNRYWMEKRSAAGVKIVLAHNSYRQCLRVLRSNESLGFILDQNMINREGIFVDFFGQQACTTPGLAVLSAHAGAPVLPAFMLREADGRHLVKFLPLLEPPGDRSPESIRVATQQYTKIIEQIVREHPEQWIWMHRRWRTQPRVKKPRKKKAGAKASGKTIAPSQPP